MQRPGRRTTPIGATHKTRPSRVGLGLLALVVVVVVVVASVLSIQEQRRVVASDKVAWSSLMTYATQAGPLAGVAPTVMTTCPVTNVGQLDQLSGAVTSTMALMDRPAQVAIEELLADGWRGVDGSRPVFGNGTWNFEATRDVSGHEASVAVTVTTPSGATASANVTAQADYAIALSYGLLSNACPTND